MVSDFKEKVSHGGTSKEEKKEINNGGQVYS